MSDWYNRWKKFKDGSPILEFLNSFNQDEPGYYRVKALYEQLENYFQGNVPEDIQNRFIQDWHRDYILENLQTHDWDRLYKALKEKFEGIELYESPRSGRKKDYFQVRFPKPLTNEVKKICEELATFFNYSISRAEGSVVSFEPEYPEEVKDDLSKTSFGFVYHIMPLEDEFDEYDVESVEKNGFRPRNGRLRRYKDPETGKRTVDRYRNFSPRIYVYNLGERLAKSEEGRKEQFEELLEMKGLTWNECAIFAIDIQHFPGNFYRDSVAADDKAAYTFQSISADRVIRIH